jgi:hypothetical protein
VTSPGSVAHIVVFLLAFSYLILPELRFCGTYGILVMEEKEDFSDEEYDNEAPFLSRVVVRLEQFPAPVLQN